MASLGGFSPPFEIFSTAGPEDYLYNYVEQNTNINIWYDYLQPAHSDIHQILMDIIRDTRRINSLESPR